MQGAQQVLGLLRADAGQQAQGPPAGHRVPRVLGQAQQRQQVLDVGRFDELQAAVLDERQAVLRQLAFQQDAVMRRAEQHRLLGQRNPAPLMIEDPADDERDLLVLVLASDQLGRRAGGARRPEILGVPLAGVGDHAVGRLQNRLRAAVVLFQRDDPGAGELLREVHDVADRRRTEGVDGLRVVADDGQTPAVRAQALQQPRLQAVRVLVLVHQHAVEAAADGRAGLGVVQQLTPFPQQIVVVEDVQFGFALRVRREQLL